MRARGPYLLAIDPPAVGRFARGGAHRGEIGSRAGFGQADAGVKLAARDTRQIAFTLRLAAIAQDQRSGLPVGDPVRPDGRARREQFLDHDIAFERMPVAAAIARRQRHTDIAGLPQRTAEIGVETGPAIGTADDVALRLVIGQPTAQIVAQRRDIARRVEGIECKALHVAPAMQ